MKKFWQKVKDFFKKFTFSKDYQNSKSRKSGLIRSLITAFTYFGVDIIMGLIISPIYYQFFIIHLLLHLSYLIASVIIADIIYYCVTLNKYNIKLKMSQLADLIQRLIVRKKQETTPTS